MEAWNAEKIKQKLQSDDTWVERAVMAIFDKQTASEQRLEEAIIKNNVGFNKPDSSLMSYYARWIRSGHHLSGNHLEKARKGILKYAGQLAKIANHEI